MLQFCSSFFLCVHNRERAQLAGTVSGHGSWVLSVSVSSDNVRFASGSSDRTVKVLDSIHQAITILLLSQLAILYVTCSQKDMGYQ